MSLPPDRDEDDRVTLAPGACVAGRFDVHALAGAGGVGSVYRAVERGTGRAVALKLLHRGGEAEARFAREAAVLASLEHPGIVRYLDFGVAEGGASYLAMEWVDGLDLQRRLREGPIAPADALCLARAVADALAEAHRRGVVHRDLKPANLLLVDGRFDAVKIVDFGLALPAEDTEALTAPGALLGTPSYMAPEQVRGERADPRADVYALGAVLHRCLAGAAPFRGDSALAVLAKVLLDEPPDLGALRPDAPAALVSLVRRLLAKDPAARPADGAALARALAALRPDGAAPAPAAVSEREERVASLVLSASRLGRGGASARPPPRRDDGTLSEAPAAQSSGRFDVLRDALRELGGAVELLADGTRLVTVRGASPAEQAALAARCALCLAALRPRGAHVVATGRVLLADGAQTGEVIDRAAGHLTALRGRGHAAAGVHVDEATAHLLDDRFEVRGEGPWRGLAGAREGAAGARTVLGRVTPCVGRARELAALGASLDDAREEPRARAVVVYGAPGEGKSRLVQEFLAREAARLEGSTLRAQAERARTGAPFALAAQLVRGAAGVTPSDAPEACAARIRAMVARDVPGERAGRAAEFLAEVSGAAAPQGEASHALRAARVDASLLADALADAWVAWLRGRVARGLVTLVIEDLQWGDAASVKLLDVALEALHDRPLLVVATARHEAREAFPELWTRRPLEVVHLGALPRRAAEQLVRDALRGDVDDATVAALVERSGAHPFHLEELIRAVASGRSPDALPDSVLAMVQSRIDHLDVEARRTLRAASVFGESFWPGGVAALLGPPATPYAVSARLAELIAREVLVRKPASRVAGEAEYGFRHALVHDAAYAALPERERAEAHRAAGAWLERAGEADPALLADHFERGADPARAAAWLRRAAERSLQGDDLARASDLAGRAAACAPDPAALGAARAVQCEAAFWRGELDDAVRFAAEAAERMVPGEAAWFDAVSVAVSALGQRGRNEAVARWVARAAEVTSAPDARGAQLITLCRGLTQLYWAHHGSDLREVHARLYDLAQPLDALGPYHAGWVYRVHAEGLWLRAHEVDRSLEALDASCEAYERADARRALCLTWINSASLHGWAGEFERSDALLARGAAEAARLRAGFLTRYAEAVRGVVGAWRGDPDAEATLAGALPGFLASPRVSYLLLVFAGGLALERGDIAVAEARCREALALAVAPELRPAATALLARVFLAKRARSQAAEVAREAVRIERATRDLELTTGMADVALAEALDALGDRAGAAAALTEATGRLRTLAGRIASPARRARFLARRHPNARVCALAAAYGLPPV